MARTITIKKGGGGIYSPGWHELTISKAKYSEYQGTKCIDIWFKGYPDNFNARVYAKNGKNGEEFAIGQVYRFANAGITGAPLLYLRMMQKSLVRMMLSIGSQKPKSIMKIMLRIILAEITMELSSLLQKVHQQLQLRLMLLSNS